MAVREVLRYPNPLLKRPAEPAGRLTPALRDLATDLVDTMRASPATVGLAAPQVGASVRALALDVAGHPRAATSHGLLVLFDPEVASGGDHEVLREGCLSVPDLTANVRRPRDVRVTAMGPDGLRAEYDLSGFEARALLHEIDHLDGLLILDRVAAASELFPRRVYR